MLCENIIQQKATDVFRELLKKKPLFLGSTVEMPRIWHVLQCNLVDWDQRVQEKDKFVEKLNAFMCQLNFNIVFYYAYGKLMQNNKHVHSYFLSRCFIKFHKYQVHICTSPSIFNNPKFTILECFKVYMFMFQQMFCIQVVHIGVKSLLLFHFLIWD